MEDKINKRRQRSLVFFADKKGGKYKRRKVEDKNKNGILPNPSDEKDRYRINVILTNVALILTDRFGNCFSGSSEFIANIKVNFANSNVILFTDDVAEIDLASKKYPIDGFVKLEKDGIVATLKERPVLFLRKFIMKKFGVSSLTGPYILITNVMAAHNSKQYDVIHDVRRYYVFDTNTLIGVDYESLLNELKNSVRNFFVV